MQHVVRGLFDAANAGHTILVPNTELAAALFDAVERMHVSAGAGVWPTPPRRTLEADLRIRTHGTITRWVEQTWLTLGGASCATGVQDLEHVGRVFARLRELEEQGLPDAADMTDCFSDLYADQGAASPVEIMTIHKAKGLEFDMVIVPALDRHIPQNRDELLLSHQFARAGRDGMVMAARPGVGEEADDLQLGPEPVRVGLYFPLMRAWREWTP